MNSAYFISDSHLREQMYAHRPLIRSDFYRGLTSIACQIMEQGGDAPVVFCGDNFNFKKIFAKDAQLLQTIVNMFKDTGHPVYGIQGNHDLNDEVSWLEVCGGTSINRKVVDIGGLTISGLDYIPGENIFRSLEALEKDGLCSDILVLHQPFKHLCAWDPYALNVDDVPECISRAVVTGHVHVPDIRLNTIGRQIISVGSTVPNRFGEKDGCYLKFDGTQFIHIPTPVQRRMYRYRIKTDEDRDEVLGLVQEWTTGSGPNDWPLVEVVFVDGYPEDVSKFKQYENVAHFFFGSDIEKMVEETEDAVSTDIEWNTIVNKCTRSPMAADVVQRLLRDPEAKVLEELKEKFKKEMEDRRNGIARRTLS